MAQSIFSHMVTQLRKADLFEIDSAATSREEIGNPPHYGTVEKLREAGIPLVPHRARQMNVSDYDYYDYLIGMDSYNIKNMMQIANGDPDHKIYSLLQFAGSDRSIADPWYTGNFDDTFDDITEGLQGFLHFLGEDS